MASNLKEPIVNSEFERLNTFVQSKVPNDVEFKIPLINVGFVRIFLSNLNENKSTGLGNIGPKILKISANKTFQMREVNLDSTLPNLRSVANKHYGLPQARCNLFKGSLSFSGVLIWNSIPIGIRNLSSLHMFSKRCSEWIRR